MEWNTVIEHYNFHGVICRIFCWVIFFSGLPHTLHIVLDKRKTKQNKKTTNQPTKITVDVHHLFLPKNMCYLTLHIYWSQKLISCAPFSLPPTNFHSLGLAPTLCTDPIFLYKSFFSNSEVAMKSKTEPSSGEWKQKEWKSTLTHISFFLTLWVLPDYSSKFIFNHILSFIEPIREGVRKNSLICKLMMPHFHSYIMIGFNKKIWWYYPIRYHDRTPVGVNRLFFARN